MKHSNKNIDTLPFKGRGAQINTANPYLRQQYVAECPEEPDAEFIGDEKTRYFEETPRKIVNRVDSPDLGMKYSMNPYQGCEHGCIYCYARNTHHYWGFSAGLDFERNIIAKKNAPELLEEFLQHYKGIPEPIMLSGNTDCYQPVEQRLGITRRMLEILMKYRYPVGIITKNKLVLRDIDILTELNRHDLVHVSISITSLDKELQGKLEPRTATALNRLKVVKQLSDAGIPVHVMVAPIIPGLNSHEIPAIIRVAADHGAVSAAYTIVRLNGAVAEIFTDWINRAYPEKARKVLHQITDCHSGQLNDSRFGKRLKGEGKIAEAIATLFRVSKEKYMKDREMKSLNLQAFRKPVYVRPGESNCREKKYGNPHAEQMKLFEEN